MPTQDFNIIEMSLRLLYTSATHTAQLAIAFMLLAILIKKDKVLDSFKSCSIETLRNLALMTINITLTIPLVLLVSMHLEEYKFSQSSEFLTDHFSVPVIFFIAIFFGDFVAYWRHRLEHSRFLWPSHAVHHSDTQMTWLTLERFHPINRVTSYIMDNTALLLVGFPAEAVIANNLVRHYYGYFIHADAPWTYGKFWGKIFVSPAMHQWHHAKAHSMHNKNFTTIFACIDYVFGTYSVPGNCDSKLGVSYNFKLGLLDQLANPFKPSAYKKYDKQSPSLTSNTKVT